MKKQPLNGPISIGQVWVICGPVFFGKEPSLWLGQDDEVIVAVPDAFFKIVLRKDENGFITAAAFVLPNILPKAKDDFWGFATTIDEIEDLTGLDFLTNVSESKEAAVEAYLGDKDDWM